MEKKEWLKGEVEELIRSYQSKPVLWDIKIKDYKSRSKKRDTLEELALKFDTTPEEITRKIHNLRNQFNSELKKIAKGQGTNEPYVSRWPQFMSLTFLQPTMHFRTPRGNVMILDELPLFTNDRSNDDQDYKMQNLSNSQQNTSSYSQRSSGSSNKRRIPNNNDDYQYLDNVDVLRDISSSSHMAQHKEDEFETFALSIAMQMKQLPLQDALELQAEIQNLVVQKRIKVLNSMRC